MTKKTLIKLFIKFLKVNGVYELYTKRVSMDKLLSIHKTCATHYISGTFIWGSEEYLLWSEMSQKWRKCIEKINYQ